MRCFAALATQWTYVGDAGLPKGLDYGAVESVLRLRGVKRKKWPGIFDGLRLMEAVALPILQDKVRTAQDRARRAARRR